MIGIKRILTICSTVAVSMASALILLGSWHGLGWQSLSIPTGSMRPNIPPGSQVFVHQVSPNSLKVGDVITYKNPLHPKTTISHRIVKVFPITKHMPGFITKGDANETADIPIAPGSIEGKVVQHVPYLGWAMMWTRSWTGISVLVYLPALLIMIDEVRKLNRYYKSMMPYNMHELRTPHPPRQYKPEYIAGGTLAAIVVTASFVFAQPALALLRSNTVTLGPNTLSVAGSTSGGGGGTCTSTHTTNSTNVNINSSSTQTGHSGSATSSGNTNGGSAQSGSVTNTNNSSTTITITNGC